MRGRLRVTHVDDRVAQEDQRGHRRQIALAVRRIVGQRQVAGAAGWDPDDNNGFMENYLRVTRHSRRVVDRVFWGEESPAHD